MILNHIDYMSKQGLVQSPDYPDTYYITLTNLAALTTCPECGGQLKKRDNIDNKGKIIHDYDESSREVIIITMHRQNYRCTSCLRSFNAAPEFDRVFRTEAFDRYVTLASIRGTYSNSELARRCGFTSGEAISKIINKRIPKITPLLIPPAGYDVFCLCPFVYRRKKRFYLVGGNSKGDAMLLALFGYKDAVAEVRRYLELHKSFLQENERPLFLTDFDPGIISVIKDTLDDPEITVLNSLLKKRLGAYKAYSDDSDWNNRILAVDKLYETLSSPAACMESLEAWKNKYSGNKEAWSVLEPLWEQVMEYAEECLASHEYLDWYEDTLDKQLEQINMDIQETNNRNFSVLAFRLLFTSQKQHHYLGVYAYTSAELTQKKFVMAEEQPQNYPLEGKTLWELLSSTFNPRDLIHMIHDGFSEQNGVELPEQEGYMLYKERDADEAYQDALKNDWYWEYAEENDQMPEYIKKPFL